MISSKAFSNPQSKIRKWRDFKESCVRFVLFCSALSSVLITFSVIWTLVSEAVPFFNEVSVKNFIFDTEWTPLFENPQYGILSLVSGTLLTTIVALVVAIPLGTITAVFLSEYASSRAREFFKPLLELLAAVPTVVYGYFALLFVTPMLQKVYEDLDNFNALSAGLVMGIMIIPLISSLSDDVIRAVPDSQRKAAFALGMTHGETIKNIVIPSAMPGIISASLLALSRALGETMIVVMAAGLRPNLSWNPLEDMTTVTVTIVNSLVGDFEFNSPETLSAFALGLVLFIVTLILNMISLSLIRKFKEKYKVNTL